MRKKRERREKKREKRREKERERNCAKKIVCFWAFFAERIWIHPSVSVAPFFCSFVGLFLFSFSTRMGRRGGTLRV